MTFGRCGNVHQCGHLAFVPVPHRHEALELNLVRKGRCTYLIDGARFELGPGHVLFLFPAQEHVLLDTSADHRAWVAHVSAELVQRVCTSPATRVLTGREPPARFASALSPARARHLGRLFGALFQDIQDDAQFNAGLAFALLTAWSEHMKGRALVPEAEADPAVDRALRLLRERDDLTLDALARAAGVSRSVLTRSFKRDTGVSVLAYKNRLRIERFLGLYGDGQERTMLDAALSAGFGSYAQFHRVFRSVMGYAPSELKRGLA